MPALQDCLKPQDLCRMVASEPDPEQRAEVIAHMRGLIAQERRIPQSPQNASYLTVAEMVLDFLEETLNSRYSQTVQ
jgi:hypothetical protein